MSDTKEDTFIFDAFCLSLSSTNKDWMATVAQILGKVNLHKFDKGNLSRNSEAQSQAVRK